jgi:putative ABC transport system permease protein
VTFGDYLRWREAARTFESLAAYTSQALSLQTPEGVEDVGVLWVTPSYLSVLKTPPVAGRFFTEEESRAQDGRLALLSERAWRSRFGGDPSALGRPLELDGKSYAAVGVVSERLGLVGGSADLYLPLTAREDRASVFVIGRRLGSASWAQVRAEMEALGVEGERARPHVRVVPILDDAGYRTRAGWLLAVGPAILVLLIGCGNLATLLLVRAVRREREMAVRLALGASRRRLAAQLLAESWALAAAACVVGIILAWFGLLGIRALLPPTAGDIRVGLDAGTLLFAGLVTLLTPLVFGVAPLLHGLRVDVNESLSGSQHRPLFGVGQYHLRDLFVVLELAFSVGLVVFVLMFLSAFSAVRSLGLNFEGEGLVVARVGVEEGTELEQEGVTVSERLREAVTAVPGVIRVTVGDLPFEGTLARVGRSAAGGGVPAHQIRTGPDYFETLRLPLALGQDSYAREAGASGDAVIVNEGLATRLWPGVNPLGQVLHVSGGRHTEALTVVGVSRDAVRLGRLSRLDVSNLKFRYSLYRPWGQGGRPALDVIARVEGASAYSAESLRDAVHSVDRRLRLNTVFTMGSTLDLTRGESAGPMYMPAAFSGLALLLAVIGVFGVMSQLVAERRVELGVRLALGASPRGLVRLVVRDGLIRVGIGVVLGLAGLVASVRVGFVGMLEATLPDPRLWLGVVTVVTLAAVAACALPARRAARLDPMGVLRSE